MTSWDPFREMEDLRREVDRAFEGYSTTRRPGRRTVFLPGFGPRQYPLVNLTEDKDNLYVEALAPGIDTDKLELSVQGSTLTMSGEKKPSSDVAATEYHRSERSAGTFVRTVDLPYQIDESGLTATYRNGLLLVTLPKHADAKPKQIQVRVG
jgi:HSP20 family protein